MLVTGASRGIGAAIALKAAQAGYRVAINYHRSQAEADERVERYMEGTDSVAVANMVASYGKKPDGRDTALVSRSRAGFMTSRLAGTPESLSEQIIGTLKAADLDGMMLIFADYIGDLRTVGEEVLPVVRRAFGAPA